MLRAYPKDKHRFARVCFADEDGTQIYVAAQDPDSQTGVDGRSGSGGLASIGSGGFGNVGSGSGGFSGGRGGGSSAAWREERKRAKEMQKWLDYQRGRREQKRPGWDPKPHNPHREVLRR